MFRRIPYFELYRSQVVKQSDVVLALHVLGDIFDDDQTARDFAYYEPMTVRDSSLSAISQAVVAARLGHLDLAGAYVRECAFVDLLDLHANAADGLHLAAMAGTWTALVVGFGGLRVVDGRLHLSPRLDAGLDRLVINLPHRSHRLRVTITAAEATYERRTGDAPLVVAHHGEVIRLHDEPVTRARAASRRTARSAIDATS